MSSVRHRPRPTPLLLFLATLGVALPACAATQPTPSAGTASTDPGAAPTAAPPDASATATSGATENAAPSKSECDAFMDLIGRTTTLRASIQRDAPDAAKAADWAGRADGLAAQAKKLDLTQPDLIIESANLATRMSDMARDLRALENAEKGADPAKKSAARARVLTTSEQVEVITREPAARCGGDTLLLRPTAGRLAPTKIQTVLLDHFDEIRKCYADGLGRDPKLTGRVTARFVITREGTVDAVINAASDPIPPDAVAPPSDPTVPPISDAKVVACVLAVVKKLTFPKPDGGTVTVVYPFVFSPTP